MNRIISTIIFLSFSFTNAYSQKVVRNYFHDHTISEEFVINQNGFKHGFYKEYYGNKMPKIIGQYKNDLMEGEWKYFKDDGKPYKIETYKDGKHNGLWREWNIDNNYRTILVFS